MMNIFDNHFCKDVSWSLFAYFHGSFYMYMVHFTFCIFVSLVRIQRLVALFIFHTQDHLWHFRMLLVGEDREGVFSGISSGGVKKEQRYKEKDLNHKACSMRHGTFVEGVSFEHWCIMMLGPFLVQCGTS